MQTIKNSTMTFKEEILAGIPNELPQTKTYDPQVNHAPKRKKQKSINELYKELDAAVANEDYELAAKIRDEISKRS